MKRLITLIVSALVFALGLGIMAYPTVSNWLHYAQSKRVMDTYFQETSDYTPVDFQADWDKALAYNATVSGTVSSLISAADNVQNDVKDPLYWGALNTGDGMFGVVEIPDLDVALPIYHGTAESVLQHGVGHLEGSALPTGSLGEHAVLTGHTGLPTAELFTDLDLLDVGDKFYIEILDKTFSYVVEGIYTVLPSDSTHLVAQSDKNLCTLVTCTPYGINSHRLLVQGELVEATGAQMVPQTQAVRQELAVPLALQHVPVLISIAILMGVLFLGTIVYFILASRYQPKHLETKRRSPET